MVPCSCDAPTWPWWPVPSLSLPVPCHSNLSFFLYVAVVFSLVSRESARNHSPFFHLPFCCFHLLQDHLLQETQLQLNQQLLSSAATPSNSSIDPFLPCRSSPSPPLAWVNFNADNRPTNGEQVQGLRSSSSFQLLGLPDRQSPAEAADGAEEERDQRGVRSLRHRRLRHHRCKGAQRRNESPWIRDDTGANQPDDRGSGQGRQRHHRLRRVRAHDDGQDGRAGRPGRAPQGLPHHRPGRQWQDLGHGHPAAGHRDRRALHTRRGQGDDRGRRRER